jgi:hypothetical protein
MKIEIIEYGYTWNRGNYESEKLSVSARVEEGEVATAVIERLKDIVHGIIRDPVSVATSVSPKVEEPKVEAPEIKNETEAEVQKSAKKPQKEREVKKKLTLAEKKQTAYDIENIVHKNIVGGILSKEIDPMWKKTPDRARAASKQMAGLPFLDEEGLVLQSFKDKLSELYNSWKG